MACFLKANPNIKHCLFISVSTHLYVRRFRTPQRYGAQYQIWPHSKSQQPRRIFDHQHNKLHAE